MEDLVSWRDWIGDAGSEPVTVSRVTKNGIRMQTDNHGKVYKIRDVWTYGIGENFSRLVTCQYAVKQPDGRDAWFDCIEGVQFGAIEPYEAAS